MHEEFGQPNKIMESGFADRGLSSHAVASAHATAIQVAKLPENRRKSTFRWLLTSLFFALIVVIVFIIQRSYSESSSSKSYEIKNSDGQTVVAVKQPVSNELSQKSVQVVYIVQPCYGLALQYEIMKTNQVDDCSIFITLRSPKGSLTVDHRLKESNDPLPDMIMRRSNPTKYIEDIWQIDDRTFSVFSNLESSGYEKTAFLEVAEAWVGISLVINTPKDRDPEFRTILKSFYCTDSCAP